MEFEFDRETDALLRQAAKSEFVSANPKSEIRNPKSPHLDADQIAAFAENALPENIKLLYTEHFADCRRCRKILSNVISLNSVAANETVRAPENVKIADIATTAAFGSAPWYRRLFAAPNLAFALGALFVVFTGLIAFTFLQKSAPNTEISQTGETPLSARADGETTNSNAALSSSNSSMSNSSATVTASGGAAAAPNSANLSVTTSGSMNSAAQSSAAAGSNKSAGKQSGAKNETAKNMPRDDSPIVGGQAFNSESPKNRLTTAAAEKKRDAFDETAEDRSALETNSSQKNNSEEIAVSAAPPPPKSPLATDANRTTAAASSRAKAAPKTETAESGGKTFRRENGVWYDAAYKGQNTKNVRRGSEEFKKLDAGLRSIAARFGGAVVILVWNGAAYRIQ